jgi:hypothetical protein
MNKPSGREAFAHAEQFFASSHPIAEHALASSKEFYEKTAAIAQESAKIVSEIADAAWANTKILNEKALQNMTANLSAALTVAQEVAAAKSIYDIGRIQAEYIQKSAGDATEQAREFFGLSSQATQRVLEMVHAAAAKSFKPIN